MAIHRWLKRIEEYCREVEKENIMLRDTVAYLDSRLEKLQDENNHFRALKCAKSQGKQYKRNATCKKKGT